MPEYSSKYDATIHKELNEADWDEVLPRVLKYAESRANKFRWLGDKIDPEDLVNEAIELAYGVGEKGAYRNWDREKCPSLTKFLIGIIRSMTSHMAEHEIRFPKESYYYKDGTPKDESIYGTIYAITERLETKTPEGEIIENENLAAMEEQLDLISDEDEDLGLVILCIKEGYGEPRYIAEETGFGVEKVNNLLKRLRRKLNKYNPKVKNRSSKERQREWI